MAISERKIQSEIVAALRKHERVAWCYVTSTGTYKGMRGGSLIRIGLNGMPDILGQLTDGRLFGIEVKQPGKTPNPDQLAFLGKIQENNGVSGWADNVESAIKIIENN